MLNSVICYSLPIFLSLAVGYATSLSYHEPDDLGIFENTLDIGNVEHEGSVSYNSDTGEYTLTGSGENMSYDYDEFRYLWAPVQGNFILRAELEFIGKGADARRKIGWMVRNTLSPGSAMVNAAVTGDGQTSLQYRKTAGAETLENVSPTVFQQL